MTGVVQQLQTFPNGFSGMEIVTPFREIADFARNPAEKFLKVLLNRLSGDIQTNFANRIVDCFSMGFNPVRNQGGPFQIFEACRIVPVRLAPRKPIPELCLIPRQQPGNTPGAKIREVLRSEPCAHPPHIFNPGQPVVGTEIGKENPAIAGSFLRLKIVQRPLRLLEAIGLLAENRRIVFVYPQTLRYFAGPNEFWAAPARPACHVRQTPFDKKYRHGSVVFPRF